MAGSLRLAIIRRQQAVAYEIARCPRPGLIGVAAEIRIHRGDELPGMDVAYEDGEVEDQGRDLLHHACDDQIGADPLCILDVTTAASLQIAAFRRSLHGSDVEQLVLAGFRQLPAYQIADAYQPITLVGLRPPYLAFEARVQQFEIEDGEFRRLGA